jgi:WS/DGAT/MGAT family acyltransferase
MERLKPMDAQFIDAENQDKHASFAIGSIAVFEGPAPAYEEFRVVLEARLPQLPIYRRKLRTVPLSLGRPVWVDDPEFDLRYHLRETGLPPPGGDEQLNALMARLMAQRLDRDYPLWEYWLVYGLSESRWAVISKVHHAMVDGVSGTELYRVIFDESPAASRRTSVAPEQAGWQPPGEPSSARLAGQAVLDMMSLPARTARAVGAAITRPADAVRHASDTARAAAKLATSAWPASSSSLSGAIGRQRRYACARTSLTDTKAIKGELGGTVNDVVLAAISGAFRSVLLSRGEEPQPHMVPSLVPVSVRAPGEESLYGNRVSLIVANLPVHVADPVERFAAVRAELAALKEAGEATAAEALIALGRYTPYPLASLAVRLAYRLPQREIVTVTTNVPGPREQLYGLGRRLVEIIPYVPIATTLRTGICILSYCDSVTFGITGDYGSTPDIQSLATGIEEGVTELRKAAGN